MLWNLLCVVISEAMGGLALGEGVSTSTTAEGADEMLVQPELLYALPTYLQPSKLETGSQSLTSVASTLLELALGLGFEGREADESAAGKKNFKPKSQLAPPKKWWWGALFCMRWIMTRLSRLIL